MYFGKAVSRPFIFFDGVPDPNKKTELADVNASPENAATAKREIKPEFIIHKPYGEEKCNSCHEEGFSNALIKPLPGLCYSCHEDFNGKYKNLHGPVASGNCMTCHNQHMSKIEKLLERSGQQLCLYCHESTQVLKNAMHRQIEDKSCTECHDPHGGENRGLLKSGTCYSCHENYSSKYNLLHGPVASGNCTACHDSHNSGSRKFLLRDSEQLCLYCHDAEQVDKNASHKKIKKNTCTVCHNPHGGKDRFLLQSLLKEGIHTTVDSISKVNPRNTIENDSTLNKQIRQ